MSNGKTRARKVNANTTEMHPSKSFIIIPTHVISNIRLYYVWYGIASPNYLRITVVALKRGSAEVSTIFSFWMDTDLIDNIGIFC
jgi:hypothetical protein